jgi:2-polyprenyl-3-methyl-5-hydroxy-6-metoxy-1,4-benzoquinol methylase
MNSSAHQQQYQKMWEDFAAKKAKTYVMKKFAPVNRVGLTNYVREKAIIERILSVPHDEILDIGCASGKQVFALAPYARKIVGVDIASSFIEQCNTQKNVENIHNVSFDVGGFDSLPNSTFDVVLCCEVLEHVIDLKGSIEALSATVREGGHILITVPHYNADGTLWGRLMRIIGKRKFVPMTEFSEENIRKHGDAHVREFSRNTLEENFTSQGYKTISCFTVSHLDGPYGDKVQDFLLHRMPWTRIILIFKDWCLQKLFPGLGRHIVYLAQKKSSTH